MEKNIFKTNRLILTPTSIKDAEFILELMNTPKWIEHIGDRNITSIEEAELYIQERIIPQLDRLGYSSYTISKKEDGSKIGTCGLYDRDGLEGVDIGFALLPQFENKGYAFEASAKLMEVAFQIFGLKKIQAITTKDNISSQNLLTKLDLRFEGKTTLADNNKEFLLYKIES